MENESVGEVNGIKIYLNKEKLFTAEVNGQVLEAMSFSAIQKKIQDSHEAVRAIFIGYPYKKAEEVFVVGVKNGKAVIRGKRGLWDFDYIYTWDEATYQAFQKLEQEEKELNEKRYHLRYQLARMQKSLVPQKK